ncbi:hydrolase 1, exosortase A system-associated [Aliiglaciecola lipolytica]|uniref:Esterase/lipase/thioesterase family protein n=1 Tax=Aliiglaciecola lipolytica E3 TaxID=1127673 RepID=K6YA88_9ALTE|nr:hydrolase 1, exosortase A system-associated [Aliiglaciecola lipolytica]GAC15107.1 esterase/lipase/thioesterase family protein [Aliiglaciecola lipolytica E3]
MTHDMLESAVVFSSENSQLMGILHQPQTPINTAVLIVVGGPQYRVGSHRQFVQLSRALAKENIASLRFDYTGMGDSEGSKKPFDEINEDIKAACDLLCEQVGIESVVIWGLCDAASAAMIYAPQDDRITGLFLLNPWLRSDAAMGKAMLKYYYLQRLFSKEFWSKLLRGKVNVASSIGDAKGFVADSVSSQNNHQQDYQTRMQKGLENFKGKVCLVLSGIDLTAKEFEQQTINNKAWKKLNNKQSTIHRISKADHTFSSAEFKREVEKYTVEFVNKNKLSCV